MLYRCVSNEERHLSLGVISFFVRALGSIPGPLITGALFDTACLLRHEQQEQCGLIGNCLVYDSHDLALRTLALFLAGMVISTVFAFLVWLVYPKTKKRENEDKIEKGREPLPGIYIYMSNYIIAIAHVHYNNSSCSSFSLTAGKQTSLLNVL